MPDQIQIQNNNQQLPTQPKPPDLSPPQQADINQQPQSTPLINISPQQPTPSVSNLKLFNQFVEDITKSPSSILFFTTVPNLAGNVAIHQIDSSIKKKQLSVLEKEYKIRSIPIELLQYSNRTINELRNDPTTRTDPRVNKALLNLIIAANSSGVNINPSDENIPLYQIFERIQQKQEELFVQHIDKILNNEKLLPFSKETITLKDGTTITKAESIKKDLINLFRIDRGSALALLDDLNKLTKPANPQMFHLPYEFIGHLATTPINPFFWAIYFSKIYANKAEEEYYKRNFGELFELIRNKSEQETENLRLLIKTAIEFGIADTIAARSSSIASRFIQTATGQSAADVFYANLRRTLRPASWNAGMARIVSGTLTDFGFSLAGVPTPQGALIGTAFGLIHGIESLATNSWDDYLYGNCEAWLSAINNRTPIISFFSDTSDVIKGILYRDGELVKHGLEGYMKNMILGMPDFVSLTVLGVPGIFAPNWIGRGLAKLELAQESSARLPTISSLPLQLHNSHNISGPSVVPEVLFRQSLSKGLESFTSYDPFSHLMTGLSLNPLLSPNPTQATISNATSLILSDLINSNRYLLVNWHDEKVIADIFRQTNGKLKTRIPQHQGTQIDQKIQNSIIPLASRTDYQLKILQQEIESLSPISKPGNIYSLAVEWLNRDKEIWRGKGLPEDLKEKINIALSDPYNRAALHHCQEDLLAKLNIIKNQIVKLREKKPNLQNILDVELANLSKLEKEHIDILTSPDHSPSSVFHSLIWSYIALNGVSHLLDRLENFDFVPPGYVVGSFGLRYKNNDLYQNRVVANIVSKAIEEDFLFSVFASFNHSEVESLNSLLSLKDIPLQDINDHELSVINKALMSTAITKNGLLTRQALKLHNQTRFDGLDHISLLEQTFYYSLIADYNRQSQNIDNPLDYIRQDFKVYDAGMMLFRTQELMSKLSKNENINRLISSVVFSYHKQISDLLSGKIRKLSLDNERELIFQFVDNIFGGQLSEESKNTLSELLLMNILHSYTITATKDNELYVTEKPNLDVSQIVFRHLSLLYDLKEDISSISLPKLSKLQEELLLIVEGTKDKEETSVSIADYLLGLANTNTRSACQFLRPELLQENSNCFMAGLCINAVSNPITKRKVTEFLKKSAEISTAARRLAGINPVKLKQINELVDQAHEIAKKDPEAAINLLTSLPELKSLKNNESVRIATIKLKSPNPEIRRQGRETLQNIENSVYNIIKNEINNAVSMIQESQQTIDNYLNAHVAASLKEISEDDSLIVPVYLISPGTRQIIKCDFRQKDHLNTIYNTINTSTHTRHLSTKSDREIRTAENLSSADPVILVTNPTKIVLQSTISYSQERQRKLEKIREAAQAPSELGTHPDTTSALNEIEYLYFKNLESSAKNLLNLTGIIQKNNSAIHNYSSISIPTSIVSDLAALKTINDSDYQLEKILTYLHSISSEQLRKNTELIMLSNLRDNIDRRSGFLSSMLVRVHKFLKDSKLLQEKLDPQSEEFQQRQQIIETLIDGYIAALSADKATEKVSGSELIAKHDMELAGNLAKLHEDLSTLSPEAYNQLKQALQERIRKGTHKQTEIETILLFFSILDDTKPNLLKQLRSTDVDPQQAQKFLMNNIHDLYSKGLPQNVVSYIEKRPKLYNNFLKLWKDYVNYCYSEIERQNINKIRKKQEEKETNKTGK